MEKQTDVSEIEALTIKMNSRFEWSNNPIKTGGRDRKKKINVNTA
jgi:hypothetical protein